MMKKIILSILKVIANIFYYKIDLFSNKILHPYVAVKMGFIQKIIGINRNIPWPVHHTSMVNNWKNVIREGNASFPGYMPGCYIQASSKIFIGSETRIGPGVKIIAQNHDIYDIDNHLESEPIKIGRNCWISANAIVLPEVILGDYTVVAAGAVVNKSFIEGYCVIGGIPAKIIKRLDKEKIR